MIATCWNQRSLLRESAGIGRPRGARYWVSSIDSSPSRMRDDAHAQAEDALEMLVVFAATSTSETFSKVSTLAKKSTDRSMSATVMPTTSTPLTSGRRLRPPQRPPTAGEPAQEKRRASEPKRAVVGLVRPSGIRCGGAPVSAPLRTRLTPLVAVEGSAVNSGI